MADEWYYVRGDERHGPVSFDRLRSLLTSGWLGPDDRVWGPGLADWVPARDVDGLVATSPLGRVLGRTIAGLRPPSEPASAPRREADPVTSRSAGFEWDQLSPRHAVAACGVFLTALGIAFTAIAGSRLALAFTLSGLFVAAVGLHVELARLLRQAAANVRKAAHEAAERRLRNRELALERRRLEVEAARLAGQRAAPEPPAAVAPSPAGELPVAADAGRVVIIHHAPVQRWSPGLAAILSCCVPGLGQLYKGQILNALVWFVFVSLGYAALVLPGLVLHFCCVLGALSGNPWTGGGTTVVRE